MVASGIENSIIDYALSLSLDDLSSDAINQAKRRILDTFGCALGGMDSDPARIAMKMAQGVTAGPSSRIFGSLVTTTPESAAFANGTMLRYLDINDTHRTIDGSHPSDNFGGLVAMVEALDGSGRDLLLAFAISYEIQCRFVDSVPFNDNGWDQPVPGIMACALACARLLGLDREKTRNALALAVIPNLCTYQTRAGELSMWKGCAAANGSRNGIFAARLAAEGLTGPYEAFDGIFGLWNQTVPAPARFPELVRREGTHSVQQTNIKMYPVRDSCQLPVETAKDLRAKISASEIAALTIDTYQSAHKGAVADPELWAPKTRETADHSMLVSIAVTLIDGTITPDSFSEKRFLDADVLALINRTNVNINETFSNQAPATRNCRLTAVTSDGASHVAHRTLTAADIEAGPSDDDLLDKFRMLTNAHYSPEFQDRMIEACMAIEECERISELVDLTALHEGSTQTQ